MITVKQKRPLSENYDFFCFLMGYIENFLLFLLIYCIPLHYNCNQRH